MNAGDWFVNKKILTRISREFKNKIDLISGDVNYIYPSYSKYYPSKGLSYVYKGMFCCHQALFSSTVLMKKYKFDTSYKVSADYEFVLRCYKNGYKFKFVNFLVANFTPDGFAQSNAILGAINDLSIQVKYLDNPIDIYKSSSFSSLEKNKPDNNKFFSVILNKFYEQLFELDLNNKKIVLYGYGLVGNIIYTKYKNKISYIVDQNYNSFDKANEDIQSPDIFATIEFDYVIISVLGREDEIIDYLSSTYQISKERFISFHL
jgi:hypothetical protein